MKEQNEKEKPIKMKRKWNSEKKFYLATAIGCAVMLVAIVVTAVLVSGGNNDVVVDNPNSGNSSVITPGNSADDENNSGDSGNSGNQGDNTDDEQVSGLPDGMIAPIESVSVSNGFGFYYNQTLNSYYEHKGMDFVADAGTEVMAVDAGTVESIYKDDILLGTQITIVHDNGLKSVYRFVTETESLSVGDRVEKGEVIATVAEATGDEYKDGAHLHFAVEKDGKAVDPTQYLTLEEK